MIPIARHEGGDVRREGFISDALAPEYAGGSNEWIGLVREVNAATDDIIFNVTYYSDNEREVREKVEKLCVRGLDDAFFLPAQRKDLQALTRQPVADVNVECGYVCRVYPLRIQGFYTVIRSSKEFVTAYYRDTLSASLHDIPKEIGMYEEEKYAERFTD